MGTKRKYTYLEHASSIFPLRADESQNLSIFIFEHENRIFHWNNEAIFVIILTRVLSDMYQFYLLPIFREFSLIFC